MVFLLQDILILSFLLKLLEEVKECNSLKILPKLEVEAIYANFTNLISRKLFIHQDLAFLNLMINCSRF